MGLSLEAICAFLGLSFKMRLICNQYVNERLSSGRHAEENFLFVNSEGDSTQKQQCNNLFPLVNIAASSTCSQI